MIETVTIRCTPARSPCSCRFLAAVVKNSVAASCSGEGPVAASTISSAPARASARPSPGDHVHAGRPAEIGTTSWPREASTLGDVTSQASGRSCDRNSLSAGFHLGPPFLGVRL